MRNSSNSKWYWVLINICVWLVCSLSNICSFPFCKFWIKHVKQKKKTRNTSILLFRHTRVPLFYLNKNDLKPTRSKTKTFKKFVMKNLCVKYIFTDYCNVIINTVGWMYKHKHKHKIKCVSYFLLYLIQRQRQHVCVCVCMCMFIIFK